MTHVKEAVEQLRGTAVNQVEGAEVALVTGGPRVDPRVSRCCCTSEDDRADRTRGRPAGRHHRAHARARRPSRSGAAAAEHRLVRAALHELRHLPVPAVAVLLRVPRARTSSGSSTTAGARSSRSSSPATRSSPSRGRGADVVAVVELQGAPGCRLVSNVLEIEPEAVAIGLPVVVAWDDVTESVTIPRFVPDESRT